MNKEKEMTAFISSVGADERQPLNISDSSISDKAGKINDLETISMTELYDTVYPSKPPLIDGLLYAGTYLFVGAPKLGKSFLMAQLAYHISTGIPLWNYTIRKGKSRQSRYLKRFQKSFFGQYGMERHSDGTVRISFH